MMLPNLFLKFGTAGIRGKMGEGQGFMNLSLCYHLAYAVGQYIKEKKIRGPVIVGFDGRLLSYDFAYEISSTISLLGLNTHMFVDVCPTPVLAFLAKKMGVAMAFMVTASHNRKEDNGIKLFDSYGGQPARIITNYLEDLMLKAPKRKQFYDDNKNKSIKILPIKFEDAKDYFKTIYNNRYFLDKEIEKNISLVYTPIHGVGKKYFLHACKIFGFNNIASVKEQEEPDGNFPSVLLPNPEEEKTMDLAYSLAKNIKPDLVIANDPDADRFCAMIFLNKDYYKMSGNEIGVILGYFAMLDAKKKALKNPVVASTIVSSRMLKKMAQMMNINYFDALTGFGNIKEEALRLKQSQDLNLIFAYEEAYGFSSSSCLLDKDGIGAAISFIEIASTLKKNGSNIIEKLDELYCQFGLYRGRQWYILMDDTSSFMASLRKMDAKVLAHALNIQELLKIENKTNLIIFENKTGFRMLVRPSGTEPKLKFYLEDVRPFKANMKAVLDEDLLNIEKKIRNLFFGSKFASL